MTTRSFLVQSVLAFSSIAFLACGSDAGVKSDAAVESTVVETPKVDAVTGYIDPVCHMKVAEDASLVYTHEGVTYGFCGQGCKDAFAADPGSFLLALEE